MISIEEIVDECWLPDHPICIKVTNHAYRAKVADTLIKYCRESFSDRWTYRTFAYTYYFYFKNKGDAIIFALNFRGAKFDN